jgi:hypothetical protein
MEGMSLGGVTSNWYRVLYSNPRHSRRPTHTHTYQGPAYGTLQGPNQIGMDDNEFIANVFCFGAFADKNNGVVYNYLTGSFSFILLDGSICFFCTVLLSQGKKSSTTTTTDNY